MKKFLCFTLSLLLCFCLFADISFDLKKGLKSETLSIEVEKGFLSCSFKLNNSNGKLKFSDIRSLKVSKGAFSLEKTTTSTDISYKTETVGFNLSSGLDRKYKQLQFISDFRLKSEHFSGHFHADVFYKTLYGLNFSYNSENSFSIGKSSVLFNCSFSNQQVAYSGTISVPSISHSISLSHGQPAVFGGTATPVKLIAKASAKIGFLILESEFIKEVSTSGGLLQYTNYLISSGPVTVTTTYNRTKGMENGFSKPKITFRAGSSALSWYNGKLFFDLTVKVGKVTLTINQDKTVGISFKL